jgi:nucleoside-diphosphate-sugar epimerase
MKTIFVTGGTGFMGRDLIMELLRHSRNARIGATIGAGYIGRSGRWRTPRREFGYSE